MNFYLSNRLKFKKSISKITIPDIITTDLYQQKKLAFQKLFTQIGKFDFEVKTFEKPINFEDISSVMNLSYVNSFEYEDKPVIINSYEIKLLTRATRKILNCDPEKEFFNFGNLKESKKMGTIGFYNDKISYEGSDEEKEKKNFYDDYYWLAFELLDLLSLWKKISRFATLPIVLTNKSLTYKENIKIQLLFPKKVKIYKSKKFPLPKKFQIIKDLSSDNSFLIKNIKHTQDSIVNEYYQGYPIHEPIDFSILGHQRKDFETKKLRGLLEYYFDFKYYYDNPEYTIVECEIDGINTNQSISLPSYIFIRSKSDFTIEYKITCKNEPETIKGNLTFKISS